jgi:hypothetical protein
VNRRVGEPIQFELPKDGKERREEIEAHWPMRKVLISHLRTVLPLDNDSKHRATGGAFRLFLSELADVLDYDKDWKAHTIGLEFTTLRIYYSNSKT